jgi:hypothetical protein
LGDNIVFFFAYTETKNDPIDLRLFYETFMGDDEEYPCGPADPVPVFQRGLYFNGKDAYGRIRVQNMLTNPVLAFNHYIKAWVRPELFTSDKICIYSKEDLLSW